MTPVRKKAKRTERDPLGDDVIAKRIGLSHLHVSFYNFLLGLLNLPLSTPKKPPTSRLTEDRYKFCGKSSKENKGRQQ